MNSNDKGGFGHDALRNMLGSSSSNYRYEAIPHSAIPTGARFCIALAGSLPDVVNHISRVSEQHGFRIKTRTADTVVVHTGIMVNYKYHFHLVHSVRGTDVFLYFDEAKMGWGVIQLTNLQRNISALVKAIELEAQGRGIHVSGPSNWIRPLYSGAGGFAVKAAKQTANQFVYGCFLTIIMFIVMIVILAIVIKSR